MPSDASWSPDAADDVAFAEHCARVNAERLVVTLRALVLITLVVGPILLLFQTAQTAPWQALRAAAAIVFFGLAIVALRRSAALRRRADLFGGAIVALDMAVNARSFAAVGGLETLYIGITCVTPLLGILFCSRSSAASRSRQSPPSPTSSSSSRAGPRRSGSPT